MLFTGQNRMRSVSNWIVSSSIFLLLENRRKIILMAMLDDKVRYKIVGTYFVDTRPTGLNCGIVYQCIIMDSYAN